MAQISRLEDKARSLPWLARIRRKGHEPVTRMFATYEEAEIWAGEYERELRLTGLPPTYERLKNVMARVIFVRYLNEVTPSKASKARETSTIKKLLTLPMSNKSIGNIDLQDAIQYEKTRLKENVTASTVRREFNILQDIFNKAGRDWGYKGCPNPFRGYTVKGSKKGKRDRVLHNGELKELDRACELCRGNNKFYVKLAIYLAILTGMRQQEIFNLVWKDISVERCEIQIRKSKMDYKQHSPGRVIALPAIVEHMLMQLARGLMRLSAYDLNARIFPMTQSAFSQAWLGVVDRAKIDDLHFHDLRHEAASTFHKAHLDIFEIKAMLGHHDKNVTEGYITVDRLTIREKLDKFVYDGGLFDQYGWGMSILEWQQFEAREGKEINFRPNLKEREGLTMEQFARWHDQWDKEGELEAANKIEGVSNVVPFTKAAS